MLRTIRSSATDPVASETHWQDRPTTTLADLYDADLRRTRDEVARLSTQVRAGGTAHVEGDETRVIKDRGTDRPNHNGHRL